MIMSADINPIRVAVTGITGRMGIAIIQCIIRNYRQQEFRKKMVLGAAIARSKSTVCGMDVGTFMQSKAKKGIIITDDITLVKENFDVLIDFTNPDITMEYLNFCTMNNKNMVIGTTGLNETHQNLIKISSRKIGIVYSANFSIGITIMLKLLAEVSKIIGNTADIDIIESHHNKKIDIPSGTALMIRNIIQSNIIETSLFNELIFSNINYDNTLCSMHPSSKSDRNIKIHSIRSGNIIGEHTVLFESMGERLEIVHKAFNRKIFANGALYAASWLGTDKIGLFDLNDVLM